MSADQATTVKVGQVWEDADPRGYGRKVLVTRGEGGYAIVAGGVDGTGRSTRIRLDRAKPTANGYRLWRDAL